MRLIHTSVACGLLAASLAACGSSSVSPTVLNTEKVERAIEKSIMDQRGKHAQVTCPSGVHQAKGLDFSCAALAGPNSSTRFVVTQLDDSGHVHYAAR